VELSAVFEALAPFEGWQAAQNGASFSDATKPIPGRARGGEQHKLIGSLGQGLEESCPSRVLSLAFNRKRRAEGS
jgi:hypothetical protein